MYRFENENIEVEKNNIHLETLKWCENITKLHYLIQIGIFDNNRLIQYLENCLISHKGLQKKNENFFRQIDLSSKIKLSKITTANFYRIDITDIKIFLFSDFFMLIHEPQN